MNAFALGTPMNELLPKVWNPWNVGVSAVLSKDVGVFDMPVGVEELPEPLGLFPLDWAATTAGNNKITEKKNKRFITR